MELNVKQCELLLGMFKASVEHAVKSGIPIGREYYDDIDIIRDKLYNECHEAIKRENGGNESWS